MTSKEAFEKMVEICNYYHHTVVKDTDIETICGYPIDNIKKDLDKLDKIKKILFEEDLTYIEMTIKIRKLFGHGN